MTSQDNYMYQYVYMNVFMGSAAAVSAVQKQGVACEQIQFILSDMLESEGSMN
jgi:hypothetical protein